MGDRRVVDTGERTWLIEQRRIVGQRIRALRTNQGLSQMELGQLAGMSHKTISRMELGVQACTIDQLNQVARGLGVGTWRLFYG
ncbi:helix-turn-helix domain-containing protein [Kitasatospora cheerisanensis]|uniref:Transcriptional regulator n=1 Tax=Kitasatospora cheerisanensis KCTC 2395 TaxID=1348663 RepID=A0A066YU21_9ACTN|nr:helix-turn-helix transcriptional regulator [Kitasatospora cheerisanensis]KDN83494.1 transcriptional regulator [Kitasatospora cheerisanensis KCTC 2395]